MGHNKRRGAGIRGRIIDECKVLEATLTPHAQMVLSHVRGLEFGIIPHWQEAEAAGMVPLDCHRNAIMMERSEPGNQVQAIHGWWKRGDAFIFHSVAMINGNLLCVTPMIANPGESPSCLEFAIDPWVERVVIGGKLRLRLFGKEVPRRVSNDPDRDCQLAAAMRSRLAEGADPESVARDPISLQ